MENSNSEVLSTLLSWVPEYLRVWVLLLFIFTLILLVILFRQEIGSLVRRIGSFSWNSNTGLTLNFKNDLQEAIQQKNLHNNLTGPSKVVNGSDEVNRSNEVINRPNLNSRDLVLEAWGSLKQNVYDVVVIHKIQLTHATLPLEALSLLKKANIISEVQYDHIALLYNVGRRVADSTDYPKKNDAITYHEMVHDMLNWMMLNAFSVIVNKPNESQKIYRKTKVGSDIFSAPSPGQSSAKLIGISGSKSGYQFYLEKMINTIGTSSNNDLVIDGDNFVSGNHAKLRFDQGQWILSDHSKNGTFLNGIRLKNTPIALKSGDKIGIGNCIFEFM